MRDGKCFPPFHAEEGASSMDLSLDQFKICGGVGH